MIVRGRICKVVELSEHEFDLDAFELTGRTKLKTREIRFNPKKFVFTQFSLTRCSASVPFAPLLRPLCLNKECPISKRLAGKLIARMEIGNYSFEVLPIQMRVNLRSGNAFVAQHFLHGAQVGSALNQMRGKRMAEGVWADGFL